MNVLFSLISKLLRTHRYAAVMLAVICLALIGVVIAQDNSSIISVKFESAQGPSRTWMDVGGVWDGSAEVTNSTGDTFSLTITNPGSSAMNEVRAEVTLPAGFHQVGNVTGAALSQAGQVLTFTLPGNIAPGASTTVTYGLRADATVATGTINMPVTVRYKDAATGEDGLATDMQSIVVQEGASIITKTPSSQEKAINESATWTVTVTNTGLGALFDVPIDETSILPGATGAALRLTGMTPITGDTSLISGDASSGILTIGYLAPGESFAVEVTADVVACGDIKNTVTTTDRTGKTDKSTFASITLDLTTPLVALSVPDYSLNYNGTTSVSININNTGNGQADNFVLTSTLPSTNVIVSNVDENWEYNNGVFTLKNGGIIPDGGSVPLTFDIAAPEGCYTALGGGVFWDTSYSNICGNPYNTPSTSSTINAPTDTPDISLSKTASANRLNVGESGSYTLQVTATHPENFGPSDVVITDELPAGLTIVSFDEAANAVQNGNTITWSFPKSTFEANNTLNLEVEFTIDNDPCLGGTSLNNSASASVTTAKNCALNVSADASILIANNPGVNVMQQYYNITPASDGTYETGNSSADGTRDTHEGEFIPIEVSYTLGVESGGTFTGSTYVDNYGNLPNQKLVGGSLEVSLGGAYLTVPQTSYNENNGRLTIDLDFMAEAGFAGTDSMAGQHFIFRYKTTVPDSDLGGSAVRTVTQVGTLTVNNGSVSDTGACGLNEVRTFSNGDIYSIARAAAEINVSMPSIIDKCQVFPVTLHVNNTTPELAHDALVTFLTDGAYEYVVGQNPVYGGIFNASNIQFSENGGNNPTFQFTGNALTGAGTITIDVMLKDTATISPAPVEAKVVYNDNQTESAIPASFEAEGEATPARVRAGVLALVVSPESVYISSKKVIWTAYVTNTGNGVAFDATLETSIPEGLTPNAADMDARNGANAVTVTNQQDLLWQLGDINPGATVVIKIITDVDENNAVNPSFDRTDIIAKWGCGDATAQTSAKVNPQFVVPTGQLQVLHDTTESYFDVCQSGSITIIVRNVGITHIYDAQIEEELKSAISGIDIKQGTVQYAINNGAFNAASSSYNPTGSSGTYEWSSAQIPELADLAPVGEEGVQQVSIKFDIIATPAAIENSDLPQIIASATGKLANGGPYSSGGSAFKLPARRPDITVVQTGKNVTAGSALESTVYGGVGDEIEWHISITNNSRETTAQNVKLTNVFPSGNGVTSATITGPGGFNATINDGTPLSINNIPYGATHEYIIRYRLGATCVDGDNMVEVVWACPAHPEEEFSSPSENEATAHLVMKPSASHLDISQAVINSGLPQTHNGRVQMKMTLTNTGAPAKGISIPVTVPNDMELDRTIKPVITENNITDTSPSNPDSAKIDDIIAVSGANPTYTFTLTPNGWLRDEQSITVTYYLIAKSTFIDTEANGGVPLQADAQPNSFNYPEDTGNDLDVALPATGNNNISVNYSSTCGSAGTALNNSISVDPLTPDLDISVNNLTQTVQKGRDYSFDFFYTITNNGDVGSVADHITFSLPANGVGSSWISTTITGEGTVTGNTIELSDTLDAGQSVIIRVHAVTEVVQENYDLKLIGEVRGELQKQDATVVGDYSVDHAAPKISDDVNVSGYVYLDTNVNAQRDANEPGIGQTLYAKLISADNSVVQVKEVDPATGAYLFTQVDDGSYQIVIDDNDDIADTTPAVLEGYFGTEYPELVRDQVTVAATNVFDQNFGLFNGSKLSGTVFKDTGAASGAANNGIKETDETGIAGVTIKVTDVTGATVYATAVTAADGSYTVYLPASATEVKVTETNPSNFTSTGAEVGNTDGSYNRAADVITFTNVAGETYTNVNFGDVPSSSLTNDGNKTLAPGGVVYFPHVFTAGTAGDVTFSVTNTATPDGPGWHHLLYLDDGTGTPTGNPITEPITVAAGQEIKLLIQEFAPATATLGAKDVLVIKADLQFANTSDPSINETHLRTDVATISTQWELKLQKAVDREHAAAGELITYTITYENDSHDPITNLVVNDFVPAFTTFESAAFGTTPAELTQQSIDHPTTGDTGEIKWSFGGTLQPGQSGTVIFRVRVDQ